MGIGAPTLSTPSGRPITWGASAVLSGTAAPGDQVVIQTLAAPYDGDWGAADVTAADTTGHFSSHVQLDRTARVRALETDESGVAQPGSEVTIQVAPRLVQDSVRIHGRHLERTLVMSLPPDAIGNAPTNWRSFEAPRTARLLYRTGAGVQVVHVSGGAYRLHLSVPIRPGREESGGFCSDPDLSAFGLVAPPDQPACPSASRAKRTSLAHVPEVTIISDSVASTLIFLPKSEAAIGPGLSVKFDLRSCRTLVSASCPPSPPTALETLRSMPGSLGDIVVIDVGYNDEPSIYGRQADEVMHLLTRRGVKKVIWLNLREAYSNYTRTNRTIRQLARRWKQVTVANWDAASRGKPWFVSDHVHLTLPGGAGLGRFLAKYVVDATRELESSPAPKEARQ